MDLFHSIVFTLYFTITCYDTIQKLYINYFEVKSIWAHKLIMYIITNIGVYLVWIFSLWHISSQASVSIWYLIVYYMYKKDFKKVTFMYIHVYKSVQYDFIHTCYSLKVHAVFKSFVCCIKITTIVLSYSFYY